ncbi:uncharacterized protein ACA1_248880 [Acanthamoeba castellanii str. Neff]|uniref:Uncharacterized protein n=1 Tax=Acanthamoeba castellanii (strain ATCC 30010 / Neff) TaxID=1257118 RepID=L8GZA4_ACACF|nr:uncharacterized protein ACA1_248880 [Acanthamoeba castellanii str. Neff]ELR17863.1 hypothetical protein ACA1_248880 [Acanthamoeba castellanii str. Neff]
MDVYVPVIENLEAAMITARNAMLDKGWSPDPKCYDERRFATRRHPPAGTKCHAHSAKEEEGVSESETEGTTPDGEDEPLPRQKALRKRSKFRRKYRMTSATAPRRQGGKKEGQHIKINTALWSD